MHKGDAELKFGSQYRYNGAGTEMIFHCTQCQISQRSEGKLYVNIDSGVFYCHRCGYTGSVSVSAKHRREVAKANKEPLPLSVISPRLVRSGPTYDYLRRRGLDDEQIEYYTFLDPGDSSYYGSVICPARDTTYRGFVARIYNRNLSWRWEDLHEDIRWYNCPGFRRRDTIWNMGHIGLVSEIIVAESVFSGIACGRNAIATFGKDVTTSQLARILTEAKKRQARVVFALDGGLKERRIAWSCASWLNDFHCPSAVVSLPDELDPDEVGSREMSKLLSSPVPFSDSSYMHARLSDM